MTKSAASGIQNPSSGFVTRNNTVPARLAAVSRTACQKGVDRTRVARRMVAATSRTHDNPVAPEWRVGSAYRARPRLVTTASTAVKSPPSSVTPPTTSASDAETSNEAEKTSEVTDETPINAAWGPNSTSSPAPKVHRTTTG